MLLNLFLNAADAAGPGGRVEVTGESQDGNVRVQVADDGPGIPAEVGDRVFEPFFTTKEPGAGTGLGLSVSAGIVEGFGGRLRLLPVEGGGARFELLLPAVRDPGPGKATPEGAADLSAVATVAGVRG
ncbi:ATP-binding protein [Myxococcota bacterium]|nr:ATP-binding protein [Myxococcota bacterium]